MKMVRPRLTLWLAVALLAAVFSGCTPAAYRESADADVRKLLRERKDSTLAYRPETTAPTTVDPNPAKKSYAKVPATDLPPPQMSPVEPIRREQTWGRLGPEQLFPQGAQSPQADVINVDAARRPLLDSLAYGPPLAQPQVVSLNLFGSLKYGVQHARAYQTRMEDLYLVALEVTLQRHLFEPRPFVNGSLLYTGGQGDVSYRSALTATGQAGIRQQLPYGGEVAASALVSFVDAINGNVTDGENAALALSASVPLLRGAGLVNLEPLISSERQLIYAVRDFETYRRSFAVDISSQYFSLLRSMQSINNRRLNYVSLSQLTERTQALYDAGRINFLQVQRAYQSLLDGENSLLDAQTGYENSLDDFKVSLGIPPDVVVEILPTELEVTPPDLTKADPIALGLKYRLNLQTAQDQIEDARRGVNVAKNQLLPDLNLVADTSTGNRVNNPASHLDSRDLTYSAGVNLDLPVDRVAERNAYRRSLITLERTQRNFAETRDFVISDVRTAVRGIQNARLSLEIQRRGIDLAQKRLEYSNELLITGRSTDSRDVTDAQSSLLSAQDRFDRARADYFIQILQFLRDTGTLRIDPDSGALGHALDRATVVQAVSTSSASAVGPNSANETPRAQ